MYITLHIFYLDELKIQLGQGLYADVNEERISFPFVHSSGTSIRREPTSIIVQNDQLGFKVPKYICRLCNSM